MDSHVNENRLLLKKEKLFAGYLDSSLPDNQAGTGAPKVVPVRLPSERPSWYKQTIRQANFTPTWHTLPMLESKTSYDELVSQPVESRSQRIR